MIIVVALAVVLVLLVLVNRRRNRTTVQPLPTSTLGEEAPFEVVTLGTRGCGKTLFLASMFHQLQTPGGRSYWLTVRHEDAMALNSWYADVEDLEQDWPRGTAVGELRNFTFSMMTRGASGAARPVLRFDYLEYAGGLLTDHQGERSSVQRDVIDRIGRAHALICLLDGAQVRRMLDDDPAGARRLSQSIRAIAVFLQEATCPVTFVITKWDLLDHLDMSDDERLALVAKNLRYEPAFDDLVRQHATGRIVRLVPVSALGNAFVDYADGRVTKRPDGELRPANVDVPIAAVVPDIFEQLERQIEAHQLRSEFDRLRGLTRLGPASAAAELATFIGLKATGVLSGLSTLAPSFLSDAVTELVDGRRDTVRQRDQRVIDEAVDAAAKDLHEFRIARRRVLRELRHRVDVLEGRLPSSRLGLSD